MNKNNHSSEQERLARNAVMAESQRTGIRVKIVQGKGFHIQGALGVGFGAWSRSAHIKKTCGLAQLSTAIPQQQWDQLQGDIRVVPWPH